jgi:hypothetical protein
MATDYASANTQAPAGRREHVGNVPWGIAVLLGVGILINSFDRINISVTTNPLACRGARQDPARRLVVRLPWRARPGIHKEVVRDGTHCAA